VPEKRLPLLETAGFDLMAQVEGMLRQVRLYQREVQQIRDLVVTGNRDIASRMLTDGAAVSQMRELRNQCTSLAETIDTVEQLMDQERVERTSSPS
jgi:hypothetical protein